MRERERERGGGGAGRQAGRQRQRETHTETETQRQTDTQIGRQRDRQAGRETETDRQAGGQAGRQTESQTGVRRATTSKLHTLIPPVLYDGRPAGQAGQSQLYGVLVLLQKHHDAQAAVTLVGAVRQRLELAVNHLAQATPAPQQPLHQLKVRVVRQHRLKQP